MASLETVLRDANLAEISETLISLGFDLSSLLLLSKDELFQIFKPHLKEGFVYRLWFALEKERKQSEKKQAPDLHPLTAPLVPTTSSPLFTSAMSQIEEIKSDELDPSPSTKTKTVIGHGAFGLVYLAKWRGKTCAVKTFPLKDTEFNRIRRELEIVLSIQHKNIVQVHAICVESKNYCLVMELAERGSLESILHGGEGTKDLALPTRLQWLEDSCSGLDHLHSHQPPIIHRDLKPANILIRADGRACLCDFGLSSFLDYNKSLTAGAGTPIYQAPELRTKKYNIFADIWSVGMIMLELLTLERPYHPDSSELIEEKLLKGIPPTLVRESVKTQFSLSCPLGYVGVMNDCWRRTPEERPTCKEIIKMASTLRLELEKESEGKSEGKSLPVDPEIVELKLKLAAATEAVSRKDKELAMLTKNLETETRSKENAMKDVSIKEKEIATLTKDVSIKEKEIATLTKKLGTETSLKENSIKDVSIKEKEIATLAKKLETETRLKENAIKDVSIKEKEIATLTKKLETEIRVKEDAKKALESAMKDMSKKENEIAALAKDVSTKEREIMTLTKNLETEARLKENAMKDVLTKENEIVTLTKALNKKGTKKSNKGRASKNKEKKFPIPKEPVSPKEKKHPAPKNKDNEKEIATKVPKNPIKACPQCGAPTQKEGVRNHIKCSNCKHEFCWLCMKSVLNEQGKYTPGHWVLDESSPCFDKMHT